MPHSAPLCEPEIRRLAALCFGDEVRAAFCTPRFAERFVLPGLVGRAELRADGAALFTWAILPRPLPFVMTVADWMSTEGLLWIVDMVVAPGARRVEAVRWMMSRLGRLAPGHDRALFWRSGSKRYGHVRV